MLKIAVTKIWPISGRCDHLLKYAMNPKKTAISEEDLKKMHTVGKVIDYVTDGSKTEECRFVTGIRCLPENAEKTFLATKRQWRKTDGKVAFHAYQSFCEGEVDAATAHEIGVKLAEELWGDRFEVIVATHQNTTHFHNHFCINSVSYADGKRYNDCKETYRQFREASDRLCSEYGLYVIRRPGKKRTKNYAEWRAEKEGKPTLRGTIKEAIDVAIRGSLDPQEFSDAMEQMGFIIDQSGKHAKIKHKGSERFVRFDSLGAGYNIDDIIYRLYDMHELAYPDIPTQESPQKIFENEDGTPSAYGYISVYRSYYAALLITKEHPRENRKMYFLVREDHGRIASFSEQVALLCENHIDTADELEAYKQQALENIDKTIGLRNDERNALRRAKYAGDYNAVSQLEYNIDQYTRKLNKLRRDVSACEQIRERSEALRDKLITIHNEDFRGKVINEDDTKTKNKYERTR